MSSGARTTMRATGVFSGRLSSDFFLRTAPSISPDTCSACAPRSSAPPATARISAAVGHAAWCTEPGCHHDHTSSVTNGRNGANRRSRTESAVSSAVLAEPASASPWSP